MTDEPSVALRLDGEETRVSDRWVNAYRLSSSIVSTLIAIAALVGVVLAIRLGNPAFTWTLLIVAGWLLMLVVLVVSTFWYPSAAYRKLRYAVNEQGMEIRQGILWRKTISIPKARVQHTDIEQGPIMRRYDICKLVIHTAGTQHATVPLEGLEHETAQAIRDHLIGKHVGSSDGE